mgnify:CR=1 FL=1
MLLRRAEETTSTVGNVLSGMPLSDASRRPVGILSWPGQLRLSSLPIALLLTSHTAALIFNLNIAIDALLTIGSLALMLVVTDGRRPTSAEKRKALTPFAVAALLAVAIATLFNASAPALIRLGVLAAFYVLVPMSIIRVRQASILAGIVVYGIVESLLVILFREEFNPNAAAQRVIVALCVLGYCIGPWWIRYLSPAAATVWAIGLESRTALAAGWIAFFYVEFVRTKSMRVLGKQPILFLTIIGVVLAIVRTAGMEYLTYESPPVVQEFFRDKQERDLNEDPFDRQQMWQAGWRAVYQRPWVGVGLGNELLATGEMRAHSAYLKLAIESGIPSAIVVVIFFLFMLHVSFRRLLQSPMDPLVQLTCFCLIYLLVSAFFESSGMFSIGTPTNLIAYLGFCRTAFCESRATVGTRTGTTCKS